MKLIKIVVVKILKTKRSFYTNFELKLFKPSSGMMVGNLVRSHLIKNIFSHKIGDVLFFLKNIYDPYSKFYNINEYFPLEEIKDPIEKVISNLKNITFYNSNFLSKKVIIGNINASGNNYLIKGKDIKINETELKYDMQHYITKITSPKIEIKLIFKIEF